MKRLVTMAKIRRRRPLGWLDRLPVVQGPLNLALDSLLGLRRIDRHVRRAADAGGFDFVAGLMRDLGLRYDCPDEDRARIPRSGRVVVVANHPTGISELGLFDYLATVRRDLRIVINETLLDIAANAEETVIPLPVFNARDPAVQARTRARIRAALEEERMVLFFPSGVISNRQPGGEIADPEWKKGAIHAARDTGAPILPIYLGARNSRLFYWVRSLGGFGEQLSWALLFREYLRHQDQAYPIRVGELIPPEALRPGEPQSSTELGALAEMVRSRVYALARRDRTR